MSKYAGLPDVDLNAPDVFETADGDLTYVEPSMAIAGEAPEEITKSQDIIQQRLSARLASTKFKDAVLDATTADYMDAMAARKQKMYKTLMARHPTDLPADDLSVVNTRTRPELDETPLQKLRRLIYEAHELEKELELERPSEQEPPSEALLTHVHALQDQLHQMEVKVKDRFAGEAVKTGAAQSDSELGDLISKLHAFQASALEAPEGVADEHGGSSKDVTYELFYSKTTASQIQQSKLSALDTRLAYLEKLLGPSTSSPGTSILHRMEGLETQLRYMSDPKHQDQLLRSCKLLNTELAKRKELEVQPEAQQKIDALYDALQQSETWLSVLPGLVERLTALKSMHAEAAVVIETVKLCSSEQDRLNDQLVVVQASLQTLGKSVHESQKTMHANLEAIVTKGGIGK